MTSILALAYVLEQRGLLEVIDAIAAAHHVSRDEILSRSRVQSVVAGRRSLCVALRERGMSYPEIGRLVGRDHSTVMALLRDQGERRLPKTVNVRFRPPCVRCGAIYDVHLSRPPHPLPARECVGFALELAEVAC